VTALNNSSKNIVETMGWVEFLQSHPPGSERVVTGASVLEHGPTNLFLLAPVIRLHCASSECEKVMAFDPLDGNPSPYLTDKLLKNCFFDYQCRHCHKSFKRFALAVQLIDANKRLCKVYKYGESPAFGPPTPSRVIELIGPDKNLFIMGRRCESQGIGIGSFTYYRRVIDNQWIRLIDEILKVAKNIDSPKSTIEALEQAKNEKQFQKAVDVLKDALPPVLLINGQNPITLLYRALSDGIHNRTDAECLERATNIRILLAELAEKLSQALKHEKGLADAVSKLMKLNNPQIKKSETE